jgi:hypothetical protein
MSGKVRIVGTIEGHRAARNINIAWQRWRHGDTINPFFFFFLTTLTNGQAHLVVWQWWRMSRPIPAKSGKSWPIQEEAQEISGWVTYSSRRWNRSWPPDRLQIEKKDYTCLTKISAILLNNMGYKGSARRSFLNLKVMTYIIIYLNGPTTSSDKETWLQARLNSYNPCIIRHAKENTVWPCCMPLKSILMVLFISCCRCYSWTIFWRIYHISPLNKSCLRWTNHMSCTELSLIVAVHVIFRSWH